MAQQPNICKTLHESMFDITKNLLTEAQYSMLNRILVLICNIDIGRKIVSSQYDNSGPVTCLQEGHREMWAVKAADAAVPQRESRGICALAIQRTFPTQEKMVLA